MSCPLGRKAKPAQKMFAPTCVRGVFVFVEGSQSVGLSPCPNAGHHSTLPLGSRLAWTALYGQALTDENCPTVAGSWALADETAIKCATANQCKASNRICNRSEEREQDFTACEKASDFRLSAACIINCTSEMAQQSS